MLERIRRRWRALKASEPGHRFQDRYDRGHQEDEGRTRKTLTLGAGVLVLLVGLFFLPAPGPGIVLVALGAAMIARESRRTARLLDATELKGRKIMGWSMERWGRASTPTRILIVLVATALAGAGAWAAWKVLFA